MHDVLLAFLIKLPIALVVFVVIGYAGTANKRIAGVLFTFPLLNGIAIITSEDPVAVAAAIYPLVIFNCVLFASLISFPNALPPVPGLPHWGRLFVRITVWATAWLVGAVVITHFHNALPDAGILLASTTVLALAFMFLFWSAGKKTAEISDSRDHATRFMAFWGTTNALWRAVFFVVTYGCLFWASRIAQDQKWVGMVSALPLPGLFALASLIDDTERRSAPMAALLLIRDTLFLGPALVIPFNWTFSHALSVVPDHPSPRYLLLFALWALAALGVLFAVPRIAACFDRRASTRM